MRTVMVVALFSFGLLNAPLQAQGTVDAKTRAELERARDVVWRAWFAGDSATLDKVIAGALAAGDDADGWSDRRQAINESREFAKSGGKLVGLTFDSTVIQLHGTVAVMTAGYSYTTVDRAGTQTTARGRVVEIFVLERGAWSHPFWHLARQGT